MDCHNKGSIRFLPLLCTVETGLNLSLLPLDVQLFWFFTTHRLDNPGDGQGLQQRGLGGPGMTGMGGMQSLQGMNRAPLGMQGGGGNVSSLGLGRSMPQQQGFGFDSGQRLPQPGMGIGQQVGQGGSGGGGLPGGGGQPGYNPSGEILAMLSKGERKPELAARYFTKNRDISCTTCTRVGHFIGRRMQRRE